MADCVENPIDPVAAELTEQRKAQLDRYIRGEFIFPGQHYDSRQMLETALANVLRSSGRSPREVTQEEPPAWVTEPALEDER